MEAVSPRRPRLAWLVTLAATAASTYALDAVATAAGVLLVATGVLGGAGHAAVLAFLAASYVAWGFGLRANLGANRRLLARTGTSTNVLSKLGFDLAGRRAPRRQRLAADAGYVLTELVKEAPVLRGRVRDRGGHRLRLGERRARLPRRREPRRGRSTSTACRG